MVQKKTAKLRSSPLTSCPHGHPVLPFPLHDTLLRKCDEKNWDLNKEFKVENVYRKITTADSKEDMYMIEWLGWSPWASTIERARAIPPHLIEESLLRPPIQITHRQCSHNIGGYQWNVVVDAGRMRQWIPTIGAKWIADLEQFKKD